MALAPAVPAAVSITYDPVTSRWELANDEFRAIYEMSGGGRFGLREMRSGDTVWTAAGAHTSFSFGIDGRFYSGETPLRLVGSSQEEIGRDGRRLTIVFSDLPGLVEIRVDLEIHEHHPMIRQRVAVRHWGPGEAHVNYVDLLPYQLATEAGTLTVAYVNQWNPGNPDSFRLQETPLRAGGPPVMLGTGASARDIAWLALRDEQRNGLFAGLEFDGRAQVLVDRSRPDGSLGLSAVLLGIYHPVPPSQWFTMPGAFLGVFSGAWDQAGYLTQRFSESVLSPPLPEDFPWVSWNSWGYGLDLDEESLRANAEEAARLGVELFIVDLGWARQIGDWHDDPLKFPHGLRELSDYVHQLGMRFGLHFAPAEVAPEAPVLQEHPEWSTSDTDWYFEAMSLCLANRETREWVVAEAVRMIDEYRVDYIVQDGENMVKKCSRTDHSHHPDDSNYANAVEGINWVVREIQRQRPHVLWENCENGGQMLTFQMVQQYVTSITNDATGALDSRKGVWGATYPFSPRYASRYMPEQPTSGYLTRSYMFGGPWHLMNRLTDLTPAARALAAREIALYKRIRSVTRAGRVFHLTGRPQAGGIDALQAYDAERDEAVIVVTRDASPFNRITIRPQGLRPDGTYTVRFETTPREEIATGRQLAQAGLNVTFFAVRASEVITIRTGP
jgi:alpha-galactosidase